MAEIERQWKEEQTKLQAKVSAPVASHTSDGWTPCPTDRMLNISRH